MPPTRRVRFVVPLALALSESPESQAEPDEASKGGP